MGITYYVECNADGMPSHHDSIASLTFWG